MTHPPAKLNLFLELLEKRADGFHEIDTIMTPIDLCDELRVWRIQEELIKLTVDWLPSRTIVAKRLGLDSVSQEAANLLDIPTDERNLVYRALQRFADHYQISGGFGCDLRKRIPAGAGLGGASSDAASALLCAAKLAGIDEREPGLAKIASSLGSDIPFFLGCGGRISAARATGRGEKITGIELSTPIHYVIVYPNASLSTPEVYSHSRIPAEIRLPNQLLDAMANGDICEIQRHLANRLSEPAKKILPRIDEILESLWRSGLQACQLTGSGSACFAVARSDLQSKEAKTLLQSTLEPGALISLARSVSVPAKITLTQSAE